MRYYAEELAISCRDEMGVTRCIVNGAREYVDVGVHAGTDRTYRAALRDEILECKGVLFEDPHVVREFERFFEEAVAERIPPAR
jgi:predicted O-linked N-acetylglucosamine transferase (SPINDLY family)